MNPLFPQCRRVAPAVEFGSPLQKPQHVDAFPGVFDGAAGDCVQRKRTDLNLNGNRHAIDVAAFTLASKMAEELQWDSPVLDNPEAIARLLREPNRVKNVETFQILLLNTRRRLIRIEQVSQGLLDTILVHPREVFNSAIAARAAAVVLVHNHPSGDPTPSEADIKVTRDLIRAGQLLKIEILDHVILGRSTAERPKDFSSLRELGYFFS